MDVYCGLIELLIIPLMVHRSDNARVILTVMGFRSPTTGARYLMITMTQSTGRDPRWLTMTLGAVLVRLLPPWGPMTVDTESILIWLLLPPSGLSRLGLRDPWASATRRWWVRRRVLALSLKLLL